MDLLTDFMRGYLESLEDQKLDDEIKLSVRDSGASAEDAVNLVRQYRLEKKNKQAASSATPRCYAWYRRHQMM